MKKPKESNWKISVYRRMRLVYSFMCQYALFKNILEKLKPFFSDLFNYGILGALKSNSPIPTKINLSSHPRGINLIGYLHSEKGTGETCRIADRVLKLTNWPSVIIPITDLSSSNQENHDAVISQCNPYSINLAKLNANGMKHIEPRLGRIDLKNRYTIGYWDWELDSFPDCWVDAFNHIQEVWVSSEFTYKAVLKMSPVPVIRMPHSITIKNKEPRFDRAYFQLPENATLFLFIFDFESYAARKNPEGLIKAFKQAFTDQDNVCLVIKSSHGNQHSSEFKTLKKLTTQPNICFIDSLMTREEINSLIQITDCYISLHRSEGFGLTMAEAMSFGKPVIATNYSGNTDFMNATNSYLIDYELVHIVETQGPYQKGGHWAEPNLDQAALQMRYVFEHSIEAQSRGIKARDHINEFFSPQAVAKLYEARFDQIEKLHAHS